MHTKCLCTHYTVEIFIVIPIGRDKIQLGKIKNIFTKMMAFKVKLEK